MAEWVSTLAVVEARDSNPPNDTDVILQLYFVQKKTFELYVIYLSLVARSGQCYSTPLADSKLYVPLG